MEAGDIDDRQVLIDLARVTRHVPTADIAAELHIGNKPADLAGILVEGGGGLLAAFDKHDAEAGCLERALQLVAGGRVVFNDKNEDRAALHEADLHRLAQMRLKPMPAISRKSWHPN